MQASRTKRRELDEFRAEETFHRREWMVQRMGWLVLALLLIAACAGLLGNGPLAHQRIATRTGLLLLDRFARRDGPTQWRVEPNADANERAALKVRISSQLLEHFEIVAITPNPVDQAISANSVVFTFHVVAPGSHIVFHVEPQHVGWNAGQFQIGDSAPVLVRQFVYP